MNLSKKIRFPMHLASYEPHHNLTTRSVILLAAGQGSRMRPLTERTPKCMLDIGNRKVIQTILDPILSCGPRDIVIVTGFECDQLNQFIQSLYPDQNVRTIHNERYLEDTNILSTQLGVEALDDPSRGYFIVETDILAPAHVWTGIIKQETQLGSFWVTRGRYSEDLTGGIVNADPSGQITDIRYEPIHDSRFDDWRKMLGVLSVAPDQVAKDRQARTSLVAQSLSQYYMQPWIDYASDLPCQVYDLNDDFAVSFNTEEAFVNKKLSFSKLDKSEIN